MKTIPCSRCGVQIHPASLRCTLCGSPQRRRAERPEWVRGLLVVAGLALVVGAVLVVSGGPTKSGEARFRIFATAGLTTLVPVGWTARPVTATTGTVRAAFDDPRAPEFQLAVTAVRPARGSARSRAVMLRAQAARRLDFREHFFGRILFPGGRPAWLLAYESDGFSHASYVDTACQPGVAMTVEVSAPDRSELQAIAGPIAASSGPQCG